MFISHATCKLRTRSGPSMMTTSQSNFRSQLRRSRPDMSRYHPAEEVSFAMLSHAEYAPMIHPSTSTSLHLSSLSAQDIRVTSIQHSHSRASEKLSACSTQFDLCNKKSKQMNTLQSQMTLSLGKPSQTQRFGRWAEEASFVFDK